MQIKFTRSNEVAIFGSKPEDHHRKLGRVNGIPTCCTNWWINHHSKKSPKAQQEWIAHTVAEARKAKHPLSNNGGLNYVPCPNCTSRKRFVKVHTCDTKRKGDKCSQCGQTSHGLRIVE
jgi:DNA-directed RNA polymerase subunit RPC12/RpoP